MRGARGAVAAGLMLLALPVVASAPDRSPRPQMRAAAPVAEAVVAAPAPATAQLADPLVAAAAQAIASAAPTPYVPAPTPARLRPQSRPVSPQLIAAAVRPGTLPFLSPERSPEPWVRPDDLEQKALFGKRKQRKGSVCGDLDIQGETVGRVPGKIAACGIRDAVRVRSVAGVRLSQEAVITCETAQALKTWVERGVKPAFRRRGPVVELKVAAHYACRTRNNRPGAKISEHGRGNAIDIAGFTMMDGEVITVLKGWGQGTTLRPLSQVRKAACGPFGTVLGPGSDGYHSDHFHLDVAHHRSGPYCR